MNRGAGGILIAPERGWGVNRMESTACFRAQASRAAAGIPQPNGGQSVK